MLFHYTVGTSGEGAGAYPLLFNCMLLQKWFRINSEILRQFEAKGLTINEGSADARLVKSASRPASNGRLIQLKDKHNSPEGKLDKIRKPKLIRIRLLGAAGSIQYIQRAENT